MTDAQGPISEAGVGAGAAGTSAPPRTADRFLPVACVFALLGLAVTVLHFVVPSPLMFTLFMTVGQGSFALAMAIYLLVIFAELRRKKVL